MQNLNCLITLKTKKRYASSALFFLTVMLVSTSCLKNAIDIELQTKESNAFELSPLKLFISGGTTVKLTGKKLEQLKTISIGEKECRITKRYSDEVECLSPAATNGQSFTVTLKFNSGSTVILNQKVTYSLSAFNQIKLYAGSNALAGSKNDFENSKFFTPSEIVAADNNLYIADTRNSMIRKIDLQSSETATIIGKEQVPGDIDGPGTDARVRVPIGLTANATDLFFGDNDTCKIKKYNFTTKEVTTIAGSGVNCNVGDSTANAIGIQANFAFINGLAIDQNNIYVAQNTFISQVSLTPPHEVKILASNLYNAIDLTVLDNKLYFSEYFPGDDVDTISVLDLRAANPTPIYVAGAESGDVTGENGTTSRFHAITSLTNDGNYLYISDSVNNKIKRVDPKTGATRVIAGQGATNLSSVEGPFNTANIYRPSGIFYTNNNLYVASFGSHSIYKLDMISNMVEKIAGGKN